MAIFVARIRIEGFGGEFRCFIEARLVADFLRLVWHQVFRRVRRVHLTPSE